MENHVVRLNNSNGIHLSNIVLFSKLKNKMNFYLKLQMSKVSVITFFIISYVINVKHQISNHLSISV